MKILFIKVSVYYVPGIENRRTRVRSASSPADCGKAQSTNGRRRCTPLALEWYIYYSGYLCCCGKIGAHFHLVPAKQRSRHTTLNFNRSRLRIVERGISCLVCYNECTERYSAALLSSQGVICAFFVLLKDIRHFLVLMIPGTFKLVCVGGTISLSFDCFSIQIRVPLDLFFWFIT